MQRLVIALLLTAAAAAGCATKTYGRLGPLTSFERDSMNCREISLDMARTTGFIERVATESQFDAKDVLAFLGDFGIGNSMEKEAAMESASTRQRQLNDLAVAKQCTGIVAVPVAEPKRCTPMPDGSCRR